MTVTAMPDTTHGCGWRHRVVAIGSGLGGLTAMKALKHDLVNITDALVFLTRITAQGTAHVHNRTSLWLQVIPTVTAALTTVGVLITLYVAIIRERKRAPQQHRPTQADAPYSAVKRCYEIASAAEFFSSPSWLRHLQRTQKGWR